MSLKNDWLWLREILIQERLSGIELQNTKNTKNVFKFSGKH